MVWIVVAVAVVGGLAIALVVQRRHDDDLVTRLAPLCGQDLVLCIAPTSSKFAVLGEYVGVIAQVDPSTRWVTFAWIERSAESPTVGTFAPESLADTGIIADCIRWVEPRNGPPIGLL